MSDRVGGVIAFSAGGKFYEVEGTFTWQSAQFARKTALGQTGVAGNTREPVIPMLDCVIFHKSGVSVAELQAIEDTVAQVDLHNGGRLTLHGAAQIGEIEVDAIEGTMPFKLEGKSMTVKDPP